MRGILNVRQARIVRRWALALALTGVAVGGFWGGVALGPSGASDGTPPTPDPASQRKYLLLGRAEHGAELPWQPRTSFTFDTPADLAALHVREGEWNILDGALQAVSGATEGYRTILLAPCSPGPIRLEFDATLYARPDGRIGDIYLRFNADPDTGSSARGYGLLVARYYNQDTVCYKLNQPIARTEWSPIVPGRRHHIAAEWTAVHLRLFVDGRVIIDAWDRSTPIAPDPAKWLGLAVYDTRMRVDNLVISTPKPGK